MRVLGRNQKIGACWVYRNYWDFGFLEFFGLFVVLALFGVCWCFLEEDCAFHQEAQSYRTISEKISKMEDVS